MNVKAFLSLILFSLTLIALMPLVSSVEEGGFCNADDDCTGEIGSCEYWSCEGDPSDKECTKVNKSNGTACTGMRGEGECKNSDCVATAVHVETHGLVTYKCNYEYYVEVEQEPPGDGYDCSFRDLENKEIQCQFPITIEFDELDTWTVLKDKIRTAGCTVIEREPIDTDSIIDSAVAEGANTTVSSGAASTASSPKFVFSLYNYPGFDPLIDSEEFPWTGFDAETQTDLKFFTDEDRKLSGIYKNVAVGLKGNQQVVVSVKYLQGAVEQDLKLFGLRTESESRYIDWANGTDVGHFELFLSGDFYKKEGEYDLVYNPTKTYPDHEDGFSEDCGSRGAHFNCREESTPTVLSKYVFPFTSNNEVVDIADLLVEADTQVNDEFVLQEIALKAEFLDRLKQFIESEQEKEPSEPVAEPAPEPTNLLEYLISMVRKAFADIGLMQFK